MIDIDKPIRVKNNYNLSVTIVTSTPSCVCCHITDGATTIRLWFEHDSGKCTDSFINLEIENVPELTQQDKIDNSIKIAVGVCTPWGNQYDVCRELIEQLKAHGVIVCD